MALRNAYTARVTYDPRGRLLRQIRVNAAHDRMVKKGKGAGSYAARDALHAKVRRVHARVSATGKLSRRAKMAAALAAFGSGSVVTMRHPKESVRRIGKLRERAKPGQRARIRKIISRAKKHGWDAYPFSSFSRQMIRRLRVVGARERMIQRANNTPGVSPHGAAPVRIHDKSQRIIDRIGRSGRMKKRAKMAAFLAEFARGAVYLNPAKRSVTPSDARDRVIHRLSGRALGAMKAGRRTRHVTRIQKLIGRAYKHGVKYHRRTDMSAILEGMGEGFGRGDKHERLVASKLAKWSRSGWPKGMPGKNRHAREQIKKYAPRARMDAALERIGEEFGMREDRTSRVHRAAGREILRKAGPRWAPGHLAERGRVQQKAKRILRRLRYSGRLKAPFAAEFATGAVYIRRNRRNPGGRIAGALVGTRGVGVIPRIKARMALKRLSKRLKAHGQYGARHDVPA
jgi:hypothetical protein